MKFIHSLYRLLPALRLRTVIALVMGFVALVPVAILTYALSKSALQQNMLSTLEGMENTAQVTAKNISLYIEQHKTAIKSLANTIALSAKTDKATLKKLLESDNQLHPGFLTMLITDKSGIIVAGSAQQQRKDELFDPSGTDVSDREYFKQAVNTDTAYVSDVFLGRGFGNDIIVAISSGVDSEDIGIVEGSLDLKNLRIFEQLFVDNSYELIVLDQAQRLLYVSSSIDIPLLSSSFADEKSDLFAQHQQNYYSRKVNTEHGWQVILRAPKQLIAERLDENYITSFSLMGITILVILLVSILMSRYITKPLEDLQSAIRQFDLTQTKSFEKVSIAHAPKETLFLTRVFNILGYRLKKTYAKLTHVLDEQEATIKQRTAELEQKVVELNQANKAKSDFVATMSHELRTPMNAVIGLSHLLQRTALTPKQHSYMHKIIGSSSMLLGIINDILDLSKVESGELEIEETEFQLYELIDQVKQIYSHVPLQKSISVYFSCAANLPQRVKGDPLRIKQVLINLIGNAIKFTQQGYVEVSIEHPSPNKLYFQVKDTGIGMTSNQLENVFQPFQQAESSTSRKYGGTGLGLTISKKLVSMMGGKMLVASKQGEGSTFEFYVCVDTLEPAPPLESTFSGLSIALKISDSHAAKLISKRLVESGAVVLDTLEKLQKQNANSVFITDNRETLSSVVVKKSSSKVIAIDTESAATNTVDLPLNTLDIYRCIDSKRYPSALVEGELNTIAHWDKQDVMVVDDNHLNVTIAKEFLQQHNLIPHCFYDAKTAIDWLQQPGNSPEIIFLDIQMPEMDGYQATSIIRDELNIQTPIVALTAHTFSEDQSKFLQHGMSDYLPKPFKPKQLEQVLTKWLGPATSFDGDASGDKSSGTPEPENKDEHINFSGGIRGCVNSIELYAKLLNNFFERTQQDKVTFIQQYQDSQWDDLALSIHSLKGISAQLGGIKLPKLLAELETVLQHKNMDIKPLLYALIEAIDHFNQSAEKITSS